MVTETQLFESPGPTSVRFLFLGLDKVLLYKRLVDTQDELFARILDAAARIKTREDQLRRTTRDLRTQIAKGTEVDGGTFKHLL